LTRGSEREKQLGKLPITNKAKRIKTISREPQSQTTGIYPGSHPHKKIGAWRGQDKDKKPPYKPLTGKQRNKERQGQHQPVPDQASKLEMKLNG
jgi:hypothetical protein